MQIKFLYSPIANATANTEFNVRGIEFVLDDESVEFLLLDGMPMTMSDMAIVAEAIKKDQFPVYWRKRDRYLCLGRETTGRHKVFVYDEQPHEGPYERVVD